MPYSLPQASQSAEERDRRAAHLSDARKVWAYGNWRALTTFAAKTPAREMPRALWIILVIPGALGVFFNDLMFRLRRTVTREPITRYRVAGGVCAVSPPRQLDGVPEAASSASGLGKIQRTLKIAITKAVDWQISKTLGNHGTQSNPSKPRRKTKGWQRSNRVGRTFRALKRVFIAYGAPELATTWRGVHDGMTDELFAWLRLGGSNPEVLVGVSSVPKDFGDELSLPDGRTARQAAAQGELFIADYSVLDVLVDSSWHDIPRYVAVPRALFAVVSKRLVPIAIQCEPDGPVFRPGDAAWTWAKYVVQVADGNHHELSSHLGRTHLFVEIFLMASRRHLASVHPLLRLLSAHFEGTVFINDSARASLIAPGGAIDQLFAGTIESSQDVTIAAVFSVDVSTYDLPTRIRERNTDKIAEYPWRDDASLLWDSIHRFVEAFIRQVYKNDAAVVADTELAAWSATLSRPAGEGGLKGFVPPTTMTELTRIVTLIVYTASAQHAAVNFTQFPLMSYSPMLAGSGWAPAPASANDTLDVMEFLPPRQLALRQADTLYLLSSVNYTKIGNYREEWFEDDALGRLVTRFQTDLRQVEETIKARNRKRSRPYTHLLPSLIPQSINI